MKAAFHYVVRIKIVYLTEDKNIVFKESEEIFEDEIPIIARENAIRYYQSYVDVLLEDKGKKFLSYRQAKKELSSFIKPENPIKVKLGDIEIDMSDGYGNGIGIYMVIDKQKEDTEGYWKGREKFKSIFNKFIKNDPNYIENTKEYFIHGIGDMGYCDDPYYFFVDLLEELDLYDFYKYDKKDYETEIEFFDKTEWEEGRGEDQPDVWPILETPFDWSGYDKEFWWGEPDETHIAPLAIEEIIKKGEGFHVEFKPTLLYNFSTGKPGISIKNIIAKAICAFINSEGGFLFIGIDDNGNINGLENDYKLSDKKNAKDFFNLQFDEMIYHFFSNSVKSNIVTNFLEIDSKEIFVVNVSPARFKPVFLKGKDGKEFYIRGEASSKLLSDPEDIINYCFERWLNKKQD